jgi:eukaryotic-like serine/threonine-protein kinase
MNERMGDVMNLQEADSHAPVSLSKIGPYLLGRVIGRGKTGTTYEAAQVSQGRRVAVKLLDRAVSSGPVSRQDALAAREAMILAKLPRHPGVIGVLDAGLAEGVPYIVTEFVDGQPLSEWLRLRRSDIRGGVRILRDVALAIHHAHENGILHRNLKPSNVLVDESGRAFVADFGSAKRVGSEHSQSSMLFRGSPVGCPSYMSPEQAAGLKSVDARTDVYSLGAILYEILTGRPPFESGSTVADLVSVIRGAIIPPSQASPQWAAWTGDKSIEQLCLGALAKMADQRTPSARAFADALTAWLGEASAKPSGSRKPWFWAVMAAGVATAAAVVHLVRGH